MRKIGLAIIFIVALGTGMQAQGTWGGVSTSGGVVVMNSQATITPPPPTGMTSGFFKGSWNHTPPATWPPTDSQHTKMTITGARMWDDGVKWGQVETSSGTYGAAFTTLSNFIKNTIPVYPMQVLYVFGDTPSWAAISGSDSNCAVVSGNAASCIPPNDLDANLSNCNSDGSAPPATVHADCGNGADAQFQAYVYKIVSTFKGLIAYYECWNEPDGAGNFWSNSTSFGGTGHAPSAANQPPLVRLLRMCYDMSQIVHQIDPAAKVITVSFHGPTALTWMDYFWNTSVNQPGCTGSCSSAIGGATWTASTISPSTTPGIFDYWNAHIRGSGSQNQFPEVGFFAQYASVKQEIVNEKANNFPTLGFDDENGPENQSVVESANADYLAYYMAAGLASRASVYGADGYLQASWYYQVDAAGGIGNGVEALQGTLGGTAWDIAAGWLIGSVPVACTTSGGANLQTYTCPLTLSTGRAAEIKWVTAESEYFLGNAANASGGNTVYTCQSNCSTLVAGNVLQVNQYSNSANNGAFAIISSTSTTVTLGNPAGVAESVTTVGAYYVDLLCGTSCPLASSDGFTTSWTDVVGTSHAISAGQVPLGTKPILIQ